MAPSPPPALVRFDRTTSRFRVRRLIHCATRHRRENEMPQAIGYLATLTEHARAICPLQDTSRFEVANKIYQSEASKRALWKPWEKVRFTGSAEKGRGVGNRPDVRAAQKPTAECEGPRRPGVVGCLAAPTDPAARAGAPHPWGNAY